MLTQKVIDPYALQSADDYDLKRVVFTKEKPEYETMEISVVAQAPAPKVSQKKSSGKKSSGGKAPAKPAPAANKPGLIGGGLLGAGKKL